MPPRKSAAVVATPPTEIKPRSFLAEIEAMKGVFIPGRRGMRTSLRGVLPTRCPQLDVAIGRGGWPYSRISIMTGGEGIGKTTLLLHAMAEVQKMGGISVFSDAEHKLDLEYASTLGVDLDKLILSQPEHMEEYFTTSVDMIKKYRECGIEAPLLFGLDSMNALKSKAEVEAGMDDNTMAAAARVASDAIPKFIKEFSDLNVIVIWLAQPRNKIGGMGGRNMVPWGNAPKHYTPLIVEMYRDGFMKEGEKLVGSSIKAKVIKNQIAVPFAEASFDIRWGIGVDFASGLVERGTQLGLVSQAAGGWVEIPDIPDEISPGLGVLKWQGARQCQKAYKEHPEVFDWLNDHHRYQFEA